MNTPSLGKLEQLPLRSIWSDEAGDFTPWLARPENLRLLGDTLGLDLEPEEEEAPVGPFAADMLCKNTADGSWVVVENQIEKTDHRHLGQILTYAAGLGAKTLVWIASRFTEEHRAALDWLNENTEDDVSFFGLEIEIWKIGASAPAPKFNIVSKPNDWSKTVREQAESGGNQASAHRQFLYDFWSAFTAYVEENSELRTQRPGHQHWLSFSIGRSGFNVNAIASTWNTETSSYGTPEIRIELNLYSNQAKSQFAKLETQKQSFANAIDLPLTWHNPPEAKSCKIYVRRDADILDRAKWQECFEWLLKYLKRFTEVFAPMVKNL